MALAAWPKLQSLAIWGSRAGTEVGAQVAQALRAKPSLRRLDLGGGPIVDDLSFLRGLGIRHLGLDRVPVDGLRHIGAMHRLTVSSSHVTPAGLASLRGLATLRELRLFVEHAHRFREEVARFRAARPDVTFRLDDAENASAE